MKSIIEDNDKFTPEEFLRFYSSSNFFSKPLRSPLMNLLDTRRVRLDIFLPKISAEWNFLRENFLLFIFEIRRKMSPQIDNAATNSYRSESNDNNNVKQRYNFFLRSVCKQKKEEESNYLSRSVSVAKANDNVSTASLLRKTSAAFRRRCSRNLCAGLRWCWAVSGRSNECGRTRLSNSARFTTPRFSRTRVTFATERTVESLRH